MLGANLYANFIERIEMDCFESWDNESANFTPEKASLYAGELLEAVYILGLFHTRHEKGFSSFLQCELIFPDLKRDFGFSADRAEDCKEYAKGYLDILMNAPRYSRQCNNMDFFSDNFEEEGSEHEYLQKFLTSAFLYFAARINCYRADFLKVLFGTLYCLAVEVLNNVTYSVFRELSPTL